MKRTAFLLAFTLLILWAFHSAPPVSGQGSQSYGKPEHEDLTHWAHRRGLEEIDFEGEVGFGDIARVLLRRRANAPILTALRDRFTFHTIQLSALDTPDLLKARLTPNGWEWLNRPERYAGGAGRVINVPIVIENATTQKAAVLARLTGPGVNLSIDPGKSAAALLRFRKPTPGAMTVPIELEGLGKAIASPITFDIRSLGTLHVRILDEQGRPAAARLYLTGADGQSYVPKNSVSRIIAMSAEFFFHARHEFTIDLPAGPTRLEATKGPEYSLSSSYAEIEPNKRTSLTLRLQRWTDLPAKGFWSGDSHIHANYSVPHHQTMTPADMLLLAEGEDLHVPNFLVANSGGEYIHDRQYFEAKPNAISTPRHILYWNEEFRNGGVYGHIAFLGLKQLIEPFFTGFRNTIHQHDYPTNYWAAMQGKQQGAATLYVHPGMSAGLDQRDWGASGKELPIDVALGAIDAMDVLSNNEDTAGLGIWYRLLNCGFRVAISAGTDSFVNSTDHYVPGGHRVYVQSGSTLNYTQWVDAYRRGRSFATNGPLIELTVDGQTPGADIRLDAPRKLPVTARFATNVPIDKAAIIVNGVEVLAKRGINQGEITLTGEIDIKESAWIAARADGQRHRLVLNDPATLAHTSPVYVTLRSQPIQSPPDARFFVAWIDRVIDMVHTRGRYASPAQKQEVLDLFQKARAIYQTRAR